MKKNVFNFLNLFSFGKRNKNEPDPNENSRVEEIKNKEVSLPEHSQELFQITSTPVYLMVIQLFSKYLSDKTNYKFKFIIDRKIYVWFVTLNLKLDNRNFYVNVLVFQNFSEGLLVTKDTSNQRDIKISKDFLFSETEKVFFEIKEAVDQRIKGFKSEKRFRILLETVIKEMKIHFYRITAPSDREDKRGVDFFLTSNDKKYPKILFQVKSSFIKLKKEFYEGSKIYMVVVNDEKSNEEIKSELRDIISICCHNQNKSFSTTS